MSKPCSARRPAAKRQPPSDNLDVFRVPPPGSTLEALAKETLEKAATGPRITDAAVLRPIIVSGLLADGMPGDLKGEWLDKLIDQSVLLTRHALLMAATMRPAPSPDEPDIMLIAFVVSRFAAHRRRLYGAVHESADTSSEWVIENALVATATEAGPSVSVANVVAAWRHYDRLASRSPDAAKVLGAIRGLVMSFDAAKAPVGTWLPPRDRKIALHAIDDQHFVDWRRKKDREGWNNWRIPGYDDREQERYAVNTRLRDLELRIALRPPSVPRRRRADKMSDAK